MNPNVINLLQQRFGSSDFTQYQVLRAQKYDFVRLNPAGTNLVSFFSNPIGATDPIGGNAKTAEQTNLYKTASFGQVFYVVTNIRTFAGFLPKARQSAPFAASTSVLYQGYTSLANSAMERLNDLLNRGVLNIKLAQKLYFQLQRPFMTAPPGFGIDIQSAGAAKLAAAVVKDNYFVRGDNRARSMFMVDPVQMIEPEIQIEATIDFPDGNSPVFTNTAVLDDNTTTATPNVQVGLIFDGYEIRPSQ